MAQDRTLGTPRELPPLKTAFCRHLLPLAIAEFGTVLGPDGSQSEEVAPTVPAERGIKDGVLPGLGSDRTHLLNMVQERLGRVANCVFFERSRWRLPVALFWLTHAIPGSVEIPSILVWPLFCTTRASFGVMQSGPQTTNFAANVPQVAQLFVPYCSGALCPGLFRNCRAPALAQRVGAQISERTRRR